MENNDTISELPDGFVLDQEYSDNEYPHIFIIDESDTSTPLYIQGSKGDKGDQGFPGAPGPKGDRGEQGDQGPPMEWEFCPIDGDKLAGIRFRKPNGKWSDCVRFKGKDGRDGRDGIDGKSVGGYSGNQSVHTPGVYIGPIIDVIDTIYDAGPHVAMLVDTTTNSVKIVMPDAWIARNKQYHIKWVNTDCRKNHHVEIVGQNGQLIDWEVGHIMAEPLDSLHIFSNGKNWFIV